MRPPDPVEHQDPSFLLAPSPHVSSTHNCRSVAPSLSLPPAPAAGSIVLSASFLPTTAFPLGIFTSTPLFPPFPAPSPHSPHSQATFSPCSQRTDVCSLHLTTLCSTGSTTCLSHYVLPIHLHALLTTHRHRSASRCCCRSISSSPFHCCSGVFLRSPSNAVQLHTSPTTQLICLHVSVAPYSHQVTSHLPSKHAVS